MAPARALRDQAQISKSTSLLSEENSGVIKIIRESSLHLCIVYGVPSKTVVQKRSFGQSPMSNMVHDHLLQIRP